HVVFFERTGPKVLLVEPNYRFRAITNDAAERRAVEESFARSVLYGFKVEVAEEGRVLVDATAFFLRDEHGVIERLRDANQGRFSLDESRSAIYLPRTKNFPKNTEVEATLTFAADQPGALVRDTAPTAQSLTVREHHSFVELPDGNYTPRKLDPRVGVFAVEFYDYATPITEPIERRWIVRHRLQKKDPNAPISDPVKPIIYYVDNGTPEPIRSALVEGAAWWNAAFEAAGFRNAFQVKILPAHADPMDARYNMISWVHRSTRGWSYGGSIVDPRTGEIIKGNVTLGSLRVRQDYLIGTGLIPPYTNNNGALGAGCELSSLPDDDTAALDPSTDSRAMSLARIRQLAAHEVGHTLGLAHNFAASAYGRASVMDYPAPMVEIRNGKLDLSNAYGVGIGAYDKFAITYAYAQFPARANEAAELERFLSEGMKHGMLFISDADARPPGAAHPLANLWDNGDDPVAMLRHEMEVRRIGISQFGLRNIPRGTPLSLLEAKFLPLYFHHRYQLQAAVKSVGGLYYTYAVKTDQGASPASVQEIVPPARQRDALTTVLNTITPSALAIPQSILALIPPRAFGYEGGTAELFPKRGAPVFDPIAAATLAADLAISGLLEPHRAARLIEFNARNRENPDFTEVVTALIARTWNESAPQDAYMAAIQRAVQSLTVTRLMDTAANADAAPQVRAVATEALRNLLERLKDSSTTSTTPSADAHRRATRDDIERFLARPDAPRKQTAPLPIPQGDPIGAGNHP
ncbi:MAG: zinc-dependent metalloprotease, partial [Pyrinomonadaceae bacterium]|nr:zinc-dependent metalloprotease [Pyrinomonadaceae bacterium]